MAYSRRQRNATASGARGQRTPSDVSPVAPADDGALTEDLSAVAPAHAAPTSGDDTAVNETTAPVRTPALKRSSSEAGRASSNRRGTAAGRSGRRSRASNRASAPRKVLTPEQLAARSKTIKTLAFIGVGAVALVLVIVTLISLSRPDPKVNEANQHLTAAEQGYENMVRAISAREPDQAEKIKSDTIREHLQIPVLGNADLSTDPASNPQVAGRGYVDRAAKLLEQFMARSEDIVRVRRDRLVEVNRDLLLKDFARLKDPTLDLNDLEKRLDAFEANPVDPAAGESLVYKQQYTTIMTALLARRNELSQERARRLQAATGDVTLDANRQTDIYIRQKQYAEGLRWLDQLARDKPDADLSLVRKKTVDAANGEWAAVRVAAEGEWRTAGAAGTPAAQREVHRERARALLRSVPAWGTDIEPLTNIQAEASALLKEYGG